MLDVRSTTGCYKYFETPAVLDAADSCLKEIGRSDEYSLRIFIDACVDLMQRDVNGPQCLHIMATVIEGMHLTRGYR